MNYQEEKIYKGELQIVDVRLSDPCSNGHNDFAITLDTYGRDSIPHETKKIRNGKTYWNNAGGCQHDLALEIFPHLKTFIDLHLSDEQGVPMYAIENGFYHLKREKSVAMNYLRITAKEYDKINKWDKNSFTEFVNKELKPRWAKEATKAKELLEELIA